MIAPPQLEPSNYTSWIKEMVFWEHATNVDKKKRAATVFLTLTGKAREVIREMSPTDLNEEDGLSKLYSRLDELFKEDENKAALETYDKFEKYSRSSEMTIVDYLIEFDRMTAQLKLHKIILPEHVLVYRVLRSANLTDDYEKLIRATVSELTLKSMAFQLKKLMGTSNPTSEPAVVQVKNEDVWYNKWYGRRGGRGSYHGGKRPSRSSNQHPGRGRYAVAKTKSHPNPVGQDGKHMTCHVCGSIYHWLNDCPDKGCSTSNIEEVNIIFLAQNSDQPVDTNTLVGETLGCMVLDSGTTSIVSGLNWYNCFLVTLPDSVMNNFKGSKVFKFGSRNNLASVKRVMLPCIAAGFLVDINVDIVNADIPLLLSKSAMKKAKVNLNFDSDTIDILGKRIKLMTMSTGHYYVPITKAVSLDGESIHEFFTNFVDKNLAEKLKIVTKLHKQFSHLTGKKLKDLAKNAGDTDQEFLTMLEEIPSSCERCLRYKKVLPRPVVGFSLASRFNE